MEKLSFSNCHKKTLKGIFDHFSPSKQNMFNFSAYSCRPSDQRIRSQMIFMLRNSFNRKSNCIYPLQRASDSDTRFVKLKGSAHNTHILTHTCNSLTAFSHRDATIKLLLFAKPTFFTTDMFWCTLRLCFLMSQIYEFGSGREISLGCANEISTVIFSFCLYILCPCNAKQTYTNLNVSGVH